MKRVAALALAAILGLTLGLTFASTPAHAQEDDETKRELAKQLFIQANDAAREGRYREAIPLYERALKLAPDVSALHRNLGVIFKKIGRCDKALPYFDRYLELRPDAPDAETVSRERDECLTIIRERPELGRDAEGDGTLNIVVNVEGASINVDGVLMGQSPVEPLNLKPGTYNVLVTKPGYEAWQRRIPVSAGRDVVINVTLVLEKKQEDTVEETPHLVWKWTTIGVGSAAVATGVVFTVLAELDRSKFEGADRIDGVVQMDQSRAKSLQDNVNTYRTVSYVMYGVGGAAVIGGVTWLLLDQPKKAEGEGTVTPVSAAPVPGGAIVTFGGTF